MKSKKEPTVPVGLDITTNKPRLIGELSIDERGLRCNCVCPNPDCSDPLIAKFYKGKTVNHFAHYKKAATPKCSEYGLHLTGETILSYQKYITFPPIQILQPKTIEGDFGIDIDIPEYAVFIDKPKVRVKDLQREVGIPNKGGNISIRGDVVGNAILEGGDIQLNLEVKVTHEVDGVKLAKIRELDITTLEFDLSHLYGTAWTVHDVVDAILDTSKIKVLHMCSALMDSFRCNAKCWRESFINKINLKRRENYKEFKQRLLGRSITLPPYEMTSKIDAKLSPFYHRNEKWINTIFRKPRYFKVTNIQHIKRNHFKFFLQPNCSKATTSCLELNVFLELLVTGVDKEIHTYLLLNKEVLSKGGQIRQVLKWGANRKMKEIEKKIEEQAKGEFREHQRFIQEQRKSLLDTCEHEKVPKYVVNAAELATKVLTEQGLYNYAFTALSKSSQPEYRLFNVPNGCWKVICVHYVFENGFRHAHELHRLLERLGITPSISYIEKYKDLGLPNYFELFSLFVNELNERLRKLKSFKRHHRVNRWL